MAKRFSDTGIWAKRWFRQLSPAEKAAVFFIIHNCDAVGVWDADTEAAEFYIGGAVDWDGLIRRSNDNLERLENGKIFVVDFVDFQYGELKESCTPHRSYLRLLEKHGLLERVCKGYGKGTDTLKEKEMDMDKEQETDKEDEKGTKTVYTDEFEAFWRSYPKARRSGKGKAYQIWKRKGLKSRTKEIIDKVNAYKRTPQWLKDDGQFVPLPATFLGQDRYDDDPELIASNGQRARGGDL